MIEGVKIIPKKQISDSRGKVMHMMRSDDNHFTKFGEIYFSYSFSNVVKAWSQNKFMTKNYVCIEGKIKLVLFDDRLESTTNGTFQEIFLNTENYNLVIVQPRIWIGFKTLNSKSSILANCSDIPHNPEEIIKKPYNDPYFKYDWNIKDK